MEIDGLDALPRLDEVEKNDWYEVGRAIDPTLTREEFEDQWDEFVNLMRQRTLN